MTNLKKTLAVVLAFAMILSMGAVSTFAAYSDVTAGTVVSEAVDILSNLNILTGFEDGTFRPDETVTRAQMAAIICRTLGYEDQAQSSMGSTVFNDVAADHWASGYVNVAQAQQIINGYGDGNYGPEDLVTYEQAVKMIVSALGYDLAAASKGGYPTGYLAIASAKGITKNANGRVGDAAARGTIAVLVYNSLDVELMEQGEWGTDGTDKFYEVDKTVLSWYLDVDKVEGVVTQVPSLSLVSGYDADAVPQATINGNEIFLNKKGAVYSETVDSSLVDADSYFGKTVVAYISEDVDPEIGRKVIYAISEKQGRNDSISLAGAELIKNTDNATLFANTGEISYKENGSTKTVELDDAAKVYVNSKHESSYNGTNTSTSDLAGMLATGGSVELIDNDNDYKYDYILVERYSYEATIKTVTEDNGVYMFTTYTTAGLDDIDEDDDDRLVIVYKDGARVAAKDLAAEDTVSVVEIHKDVQVLYASSASVTGAVTSYSTEDNTVEIAGTEYDLSPLATKKTASLLKNEEGKFYLNVDGLISHNETSAMGNSNYGLVLAVYNETVAGTASYFAQVALTDGTIAEYKLAKNAQLLAADNSIVKELENQSGTVGYKASTAVDTAAELALALAQAGNGFYNGSTNGATLLAATALDADGEVVKTKIANAADAVLNFSIKDGEIRKVKELEGAPQSYSGNKSYDADAMVYGAVEFDEATVVFNIDYTIETEIDEDMIEVGAVADFFEDDEAYTFSALDIDAQTSVAPIVVGHKLNPSIAGDNAVLVVSGTKTITYEDEEDVVVVSGIQAGNEVEYTIFKKDNIGYTSAPTSIKRGDVILVSEPSADNVVKDCKILYSYANDGVVTSTVNGTLKALGVNPAVGAKEVAVGFGILDKDNTNATKFVLDQDILYPNSTECFDANGDGIIMKGTANYTLVDLTESTTKPEISKKYAGTSLFNTSTRYTSYVFVRAYEGVLTDVVVYRVDALTSAAPSLVENGDNTVTVNANGAGKLYVSVDGADYAEQASPYTTSVLTAGKVVKAYTTTVGRNASEVKSETVE